MVCVLALAFRRAHDDRQQIGAFPIQPDAAAVEIHLQCAVDILFIHPQLAPGCRNVLRANHFAAVLPIIAHAVGSRIAGENRIHLACDQAQPVRVRPFDAHFDGAVAGRAKHHPFGTGVNFGIVPGNIVVNVAREGGDISLIVHAHHDLRVIAVLALAAVGQNKTHAPLTNR
ncbi:hypothetical protein D3C72_813580 [compost metagenome]